MAIQAKCPMCGSTNVISAEDTYGISGTTSLETKGKGIITNDYINTKAKMCQDCKYLMFYRTDE